MKRLRGERLQDQQVERPVQEIRFEIVIGRAHIDRL